jgi:hypothetical protein
MKKIIIPLALATTLACGFAQAQERDRGDRGGATRERGADTQMPRADRNRPAAGGDRIDARQARQSDRIRQGVASGDLTRRETSALRSEQRGIRRMERHARADGVVTPREGRRIGHAQQRASRHINQQRHDRQQRAGAGRGHDRGNRYAYGRGHDRGNRYAYGRGHDRGNHNAYGRGHNRGNHYAYGRGHNRGNHYAYGRGHNRGHRSAYGNRANHRPQIAARGHFGRR